MAEFIDIGSLGKKAAAAGSEKGLHCIDATVMQKCNAHQALGAIRRLQAMYSIPDSRVVFDGISIGEFIGGLYGMISGAVSFKAGAAPIGKSKFNYQTLKAQCADKACTLIKQGLITISPTVYNKIYTNQHMKAITTFKDVLSDDVRALRFEDSPSGKKKLIPKDEQKEILSGRSPDILDNIIYLCYFYLDYVNAEWESDDVDRHKRGFLSKQNDDDDILEYLSGAYMY